MISEIYENRSDGVRSELQAAIFFSSLPRSFLDQQHQCYLAHQTLALQIAHCRIAQQAVWMQELFCLYCTYPNHLAPLFIHRSPPRGGVHSEIYNIKNYLQEVFIFLGCANFIQHQIAHVVWILKCYFGIKGCQKIAPMIQTGPLVYFIKSLQHRISFLKNSIWQRAFQRCPFSGSVFFFHAKISNPHANSRKKIS